MYKRAPRYTFKSSELDDAVEILRSFADPVSAFSTFNGSQLQALKREDIKKLLAKNEEKSDLSSNKKTVYLAFITTPFEGGFRDFIYTLHAHAKKTEAKVNTGGPSGDEVKSPRLSNSPTSD